MTLTEFLYRIPKDSLWHWILENAPKDAFVYVSGKGSVTVIDKQGKGIVLDDGPPVTFEIGNERTTD